MLPTRIHLTQVNQEDTDEHQILTVNALLKVWQQMLLAESTMEGEGLRSSSRYFLGKILLPTKRLTDVAEGLKIT